MTEQEIINQVAWAVHAWGCPLCYINGLTAMGESDQDHVTEEDRTFAEFLVNALGLKAEVSE